MRFPKNHVVPALQGLAVPSWSQVKRSSAKRCTWLIAKIAERAALGEPKGYLVDELACLVWLVEQVEQARGERAMKPNERK